MKKLMIIQTILILALLVLIGLSDEPQLWQLIGATLIGIVLYICKIMEKLIEDKEYETERHNRKAQWFYEYCDYNRRDRNL